MKYLSMCFIVTCSLGLVGTRVQAQCGDGACVRIGTNSPSVTANQSGLLDALFSSLTGAGVDLTQTQHQNLANANLSVANLQAAVRANGLANSDATALTANLTLPQAFDAISDALTANGQTTAASAAATLATQTANVQGTVSLGELLSVDTRPTVTPTATVNALDLVNGLTTTNNYDNINAAQSVTITGGDLGIATLGTIQITFFVTDKPVFACGAAGTTFTSAGIRARIHAQLLTNPIPLTVTGLASVSLDLTNLDLVLEIGRSNGTLQTVNAVTNAVSLQVTPGVSKLMIGTVSDAVFTNRAQSINAATQLDYAQVAALTLTVAIVPITVSVDIRSSVTTGAGSATTLNFTGPYPQARTATIGTSSIAGAVTGLLGALEIRINGLGTLLNTVLTALTTVVTNALKNVSGLLGTTLSTVLGSVLDPVLSTLGVHYGSVDVTVTKTYPIPVGSTCDDGQYCSVNDACDAQKACVGTARACGDAYDCTTDSCNEAMDRCDNLVTTGCLIGGACLAADAVDPTNTCRACVPATSLVGWTLLGSGRSCNDGLFCTTNDQCNVLGTCLGSPLVCNDNLSCTLDLCNEAADRCDASVTLGCVVDGMCRGIGADQPGNGCSSCNPAVSTSQWTPKIIGTPCADGQFCTQIDTCNGAGACGGTTRSCSDGLSCTADSCNETGDTCVNALGGGCVINGVCRAAGEANPLNGCQVCNPTMSTSAWTTAVGATCNDGFFCTENDACNALAICTGSAKSCDDGLSCTIELCNELTDACDITINTGCVIDGQCRGLLSDNPGNACQQCNPVTNPRAWTNKLAGIPCTDGQYCTQGDACNGSGSCLATPRLCTDGLTCTTDTCNEASDRCDYTLGGGCIINGVCYGAGDPDPFNSCHVCTPGTSTSAWSNKPTGADCDDGFFCTVDDTCNALQVCTGELLSCDDMDTCTLDLCNEFTQACDHTISLGCTINGQCHIPGGINPFNNCEVCNPTLNPLGWTLQSGNESCDDGQWCTTGDTCNNAGLCVGTPRSCDDGLGCTADLCIELAHRCVSTPDILMNFSCSIDGQCYAANADDPSNSCRHCDPQVSTSQWTNKGSGASCSDSQFCTLNDACDGSGVCRGGQANTCADAYSCTTDSCNEAMDRCDRPVTTGCLIGGACLAANTVDPSNTCRACVPATSTTNWTQFSAGTSCSDGFFCTTSDQCNALGTCSGTLLVCNDNLSCTLDVCNEAMDRCDSSITLGCVIDGACRGIGADQPGNDCSSCNPGVSTSQWTPKIAGALCNDGQFCTQIDTCNGSGACGGTTRTCSDGISCTADSCNETADTCVNTLGGGCVINGICRASGEANPLNGCLVCNPTLSTTSWTAAVGASCNDGLFCTENDACNALAICTGAAKSCDDGLSCTINICNDLTDACDITINTGCVIDGQCRDLLSDNPANACQQCNPLANSRTWTNKLVGAACTDGLFCTQVDACNGAGSCVGTPRVCTDGLGCTTDTCNEAMGRCDSAVTSGCLIGGACFAANTVDPTNTCRACLPGTSSTSWTLLGSGASCDDGMYCTQGDTCSGSGSCVGTPRACGDAFDCTTDTCNETLDRCDSAVATGCLIGGACLAANTVDPSNTCRACVPATSTVGWTLLGSGTSCNDGFFCTTNDQCNLLGSCLGSPLVCNDNLSCTLDLCNEATDRCDSSITLGCVIDGVCRGIGADQPGNACSSCNPVVSTSQWTPKIMGTPCNDGQFCTQIDTCNGVGACGGTTRSCSDGIACTADSCNENMDTCVNALGGGCVINGTCRAPGDKNPLNACLVCNPSLSTTSWTNAVGAVCDDGFFCTENDACNALAICTGTAKSCDDGLSCTIELCNELTDACDLTINTGCVIDGQCRGLLADNPGNACQQCNPVTNARAWTNKLPGIPCTDGQYCTQVDACNGSGSCVGTPRICTDGLACTTDSCNEAGDQCVYSLGGGCIINGRCYAAGDLDPLNSCHVCTPGTSTSAWSNKPNGAECEDGLFCTVDDTCNAQQICTGELLSCDDMDTCTVDLCNELTQACVHTISLGCTIDGQCHIPGGVNPFNNCEVCNPTLNPLGWTLHSNNESCDDGLWCTTGDTCNNAGLCVGTARPCDDGLGCTADVCIELTHRCVSTPDILMNFSCSIDGQCYAANADDPNNSCRHCDPQVSTSAWTNKGSGASCGDGEFCTQSDACDGTGVCRGQANTCADTLDCTTDSCNETTNQCDHTLATGCLILNTCYDEGEANALLPCLVCDTSASTTGWTAAVSGSSCDDNLHCTVGDHCDGLGVCIGSSRDCSDGLACTNDACVELTQTCSHSLFEGCLIGGGCRSIGAEDPQNNCRACIPASSTTTYSPKPFGMACDDDEFCRVDETCDGAGSCIGANRDCSDSYTCTSESCDEQTDSCRTAIAGGCSIDGACHNPNSIDPSNDCRECNPTLSTSAWSNRAMSSSCDDGRYCSVNDRCDGSGACGGTARTCNDNNACTQDTCSPLLDQCVNTPNIGCLIGGQCVPPGASDPTDPCRFCDPNSSRLAWTPKLPGDGCDDGQWCTQNEACNGSGECVGTTRSCGDGLSCTIDGCNPETGACEHSSFDGCAISDACFANGQIDSQDACQVCDPARAADSWSLVLTQECMDREEDGDPDGDTRRTSDECPLGIAMCPDSDEDTKFDYQDPDDDNDTILTKYELNLSGTRDFDEDGKPDHLDPDDDDDTLDTKDEEPDPNGDGNPDDARDADTDGSPDYLDDDDDDDTISTAQEVAAGQQFGADVDHDGFPNWRDTDSDGDTIPDAQENADLNGNGWPDYLELPEEIPDGGAGEGGSGGVGGESGGGGAGAGGAGAGGAGAGGGDAGAGAGGAGTGDAGAGAGGAGAGGGGAGAGAGGAGAGGAGAGASGAGSGAAGSGQAGSGQAGNGQGGNGQAGDSNQSGMMSGSGGGGSGARGGPGAGGAGEGGGGIGEPDAGPMSIADAGPGDGGTNEERDAGKRDAGEDNPRDSGTKKPSRTTRGGGIAGGSRCSVTAPGSAAGSGAAALALVALIGLGYAGRRRKRGTRAGTSSN